MLLTSRIYDIQRRVAALNNIVFAGIIPFEHALLMTASIIQCTWSLNCIRYCEKLIVKGNSIIHYLPLLLYLILLLTCHHIGFLSSQITCLASLSRLAPAEMSHNPFPFSRNIFISSSYFLPPDLTMTTITSHNFLLLIPIEHVQMKELFRFA